MLCEGLSQSVGFVSDAYWEVFSPEGSCDFPVQLVRDERGAILFSVTGGLVGDLGGACLYPWHLLGIRLGVVSRQTRGCVC